MNIEFSSLNLVALAPQFVVIVAVLVVLLGELFRGEEQETLPAWLSLVGVIISAAVLFAIRGNRSVLSGSTESVLRIAEGLAEVLSKEALGFQNMAAADSYSLFLNLVFLTTAGLSTLISIEYVARERCPEAPPELDEGPVEGGMASGEYCALLLLATVGTTLMRAATNLMIIFRGLEILSIPLYVLTGLNRARLESGEAALKYFLLGAFASGFFFYGVALTYGAPGPTNLAGIVGFLGSASAGPYLCIALGLLLIGLAFKVALVPFHVWVPDVYQGAPTSVTAFMSVGAKAAGFSALVRVLLYAFPTLESSWTVLWRRWPC